MSSPPADEPAHRSGAPVRERARALLGKGNAAIVWAKATPAGILWTRLNAADFINSAFQFATYALLCIFPFMIVVTAAAGGSFRKYSSPGSGWTRRPPGMWTGSCVREPGARQPYRAGNRVLDPVGHRDRHQPADLVPEGLRPPPPPGDWMRPLLSRLVWVAGLLASLWLHVEGRQVGPAP